MNDERAMILKMLKEGKISVEEAEALMDVLDETEKGESARASTRSDRADSNSESHGSGDWWKELFGRGGFDLNDLNRTLKESLDSVRESVEQAVKGIGGVNIVAEINRALGSVKAVHVSTAEAPADEIDTLQLKNRRGNIAVVGDDGTEIRVKATCTAWGPDEQVAQAAAEAVNLAFEREGKTAILSTSRSEQTIMDRVRIDFEVTVPRSLSVDLSSASGDISCEELSAGGSASTLSGDIRSAHTAGEQRYATKSGDIELLDVSGELNATSYSGDIECADGTGRVSLSTKSGDVTVRQSLISGDIHTVSGDVECGLSEASNVQLKAETVSGHIVCELPLADRQESPRRLTGILGTGDDRLYVRTTSGDIGFVPD